MTDRDKHIIKMAVTGFGIGFGLSAIIFVIAAGKNATNKEMIPVILKSAVMPGIIGAVIAPIAYPSPVANQTTNNSNQTTP